jgi:hypothetical protein
MGGALHEFPLEELVFFIVSAQSRHLPIHFVPFRLWVDDQAFFEDVAVDHQAMLEYTVQLLSQPSRKHQTPFGVDFTIVFS